MDKFDVFIIFYHSFIAHKIVDSPVRTLGHESGRLEQRLERLPVLSDVQQVDAEVVHKLAVFESQEIVLLGVCC